MSKQPTIVLAITKRTADLCATQSIVDGAGYKLMVATNMDVARALVNTLRVRAVVICWHSWSSEEIQSIASELVNAFNIPLMMHCPGCTECDELAGTPGTLRDVAPVKKLISAMQRSCS